MQETTTQLVWVALRDQASLTASVQNLARLAVPCPVQAPTMLEEQTLLTRGHRQANLAWELARDQISGIRRTLMGRGPAATLKRAHSTVLAREPASAKRQETIQLALLQDLEPM